MNDDNFTTGIVCFLALVLGLSIGFGVEAEQRKVVQAEAIKRNYAEYKVSQQSGRIVFAWKDSTEVFKGYLSGSPNCCVFEGKKRE